MKPILRGYQPKKSITTKPPITPPKNGSSAVPPKTVVEVKATGYERLDKALKVFDEAVSQFEETLAVTQKNIVALQKLAEEKYIAAKKMEGESIMPKIAFKKVDYDETIITVEEYGDAYTLILHKKDIPTICRKVFAAAKEISGAEELPTRLTAYAGGEVCAALTKEYLVAPGKQLLTMFANNGIAIKKG